MTTANPGPDKEVRFLAEVCWLGPIIGAPCLRNGTPEVRIAGAENPALGKSFGGALVPVKVEAGHFQGRLARAIEVKSDRHGWFAITAETSLWEGVAGVLVILLYNESRDLEYYTFPDYSLDAHEDIALTIASLSSRRSIARILDPMPPETNAKISKAIADAIKELLQSQTADELLQGLAELPPAALAAPECGPDPGAAVLPPPDGAELVIAVASCQYPTAMLENVIAGAAYLRLATRLSKRYPPQCLLLVGDQIYVDGTAGFFDPTSQFDRFVRPYEILFRMDAARDVFRRLPIFSMMDDHEIQDNWEPRVDDTRTDRVMINGRRSYLKFQRRAGPDQRSPVGDSRCPLWYPFRMNGFPLFMADTRTERTPRIARTANTKSTDRTQRTEHREREIEGARIMSDSQMDALLAWLLEQPREAPKVVASPALLLPRHARAVQHKAAISALRSDGWDGYPGSLYQVLAHLAREEIPNVVFVSGDEHLSCVARVGLKAPGRKRVVVHSVHCSPLFAPFPFANTVRADLMADEPFEFDSGEGDDPIECEVKTAFAAPGDGFTLLRFYRDGGDWMMQCEFDRAGDKPRDATHVVRKLT